MVRRFASGRRSRREEEEPFETRPSHEKRSGRKGWLGWGSGSFQVSREDTEAGLGF